VSSWLFRKSWLVLLLLVPTGAFSNPTMLPVVGQLGRQTGAAILGSLTALSPATVASGSQPTGMMISPSGTSAYVVNSADDTISIYSRNTGNGALTFVTTIATGDNPQQIAISADGTSVYVTNKDADSVSMYSRNTASGLLTALMPATIVTGNDPVAIVVSSDGTSVYVADTSSDTISQYSRDVNTGLLTALTPATVAATDVADLAISADGTSLYAIDNVSNTILMFSRNPGTGALTPLGTPSIATAATPVSVVVASDGTSVYVVSSSPNVISQYSRDTGTGLLTALVPATLGIGGTGAVTDAVISLSGNSVYVSTLSGEIFELSRDTGTGLLTAMVPPSIATVVTGSTALALSPDGKSIYATNNSNTISQFRRGTGTEINGTCGTANGSRVGSAPSGGSLCSTGTASAVSGTGPWSWSCNGSGGGGSSSCSALTVTDTTANAFSFTNQTGTYASTLYTSDIVQITGINYPISVSISGAGSPQYQICSNNDCSTVDQAWASNIRTITNGKYLQVRATSSATSATAMNTQVIAGITSAGTSTTWQLTNQAFSDCIGTTPAAGSICADGSVYVGLSPDGNVKMFTSRCSIGTSWNGTSCTGSPSLFKWDSGSSIATGFTSMTTGQANSAGLVAIVGTSAPYPAAQACESLNEHGHTDWYLPSYNELWIVCGVLPISGATGDSAYWSSTETTSTQAYYLGTFGCGIFNFPKSTTDTFVRCVRK
jgi:6-phosphogluconolactonase (cycloisomerase 2 family)